MRRIIPALLAALPIWAGACSQNAPSDTTPAEALFVLPGSLDELSEEHFFDHPWPSDLRRDPDGSVHFAGYFNPYGAALIRDFLTASKGVFKGFSPAASGYLRFTGPLDEASLPQTPQASIAENSTVQIVDVDPASPERGRKKLAQWQFRRDDGVYWQKNTLAIMPALGFPLRPSTRYAMVVTRKARAQSGLPLSPSAPLEEALGTRPVTERSRAANALFAPALTELAKTGIGAADIAQLTVFTTDDPRADMYAAADHIRSEIEAPTVRPGTWVRKESKANFDVYEGVYGPSPNYQSGKTPPRLLGDGGEFVFENGKPKVFGTFDLRFALAVPSAAKCPMPAEGYPISLYGHGSGGDYRSVVESGSGSGGPLAEKCIASIGIDLIYHGTRPGSPPENDENRTGAIYLLFFNLNNLAAARTNGPQGALDFVQLARLFSASHAQVPADVSRTGQAIRFDASRMIFFGHSQGSMHGTLFLAADNQTRGGVLSGSGSLITVALLEKTKPEPSIANLVGTVLQLRTAEERKELGIFHPTLNLAQALIDATDPLHYAPDVITRPRAGFSPKSVFMTSGIRPDGTGDSFAPPHGIEIGAVAMGLPRMLPGVRPIAESAFGNIADVAIPPEGLSGNLAGGMASGVLGQFVPKKSDGHFVAFDDPTASQMYPKFCRNLVDDPKGRIPAP